MVVAITDPEDTQNDDLLTGGWSGFNLQLETIPNRCLGY